MQRIGLISAGMMGTAIGSKLRDKGYQIVTCLEGRSETTKMNAQNARFLERKSINEVISCSQMVLSILPSVEAHTCAKKVYSAMVTLDNPPIFLELNAISPRTMSLIASDFKDLADLLIDGCIIGPPPPGNPSIFLAGTRSAQVAKIFTDAGFYALSLNKELGSASQLKMLYSALHKGSLCLQEMILLASELTNHRPLLEEELHNRGVLNPAQLAEKAKDIPAKSERWLGEMLEVAQSLEDVGVDASFVQSIRSFLFNQSNKISP